MIHLKSFNTGRSVSNKKTNIEACDSIPDDDVSYAPISKQHYEDRGSLCLLYCPATFVPSFTSLSVLTGKTR